MCIIAREAPCMIVDMILVSIIKTKNSLENTPKIFEEMPVT